jgi:hypothetical protein
MAGRRRRQGAVQDTERRFAGEAEVEPAFRRAILKIALELRRPGARSYDAVVDETIRAMRLDSRAFRRYLGENGARNMSLLLATARTPGL